MKLIIAGGRNYRFTSADRSRLDALLGLVAEVVSGVAIGADQAGERWAELHGIPVKRLPADSNKHGPEAGPIRNAQMAQYADAVALFPGGSGTASMRREAEKANLTIYDFS